MWIQCLITVLRQFFKSICTTKQSDGKRICCALITDYYNPMNKHLSCQHLQYELLPHDCDAIWISPHAICHVKKSLSHVLLIRREKGCSQGILLATDSEAAWVSKAGWGPFLHVIPLSLFSFHICPVTLHLPQNAKNRFNLTCIVWQIISLMKLPL